MSRGRLNSFVVQRNNEGKTWSFTGRKFGEWLEFKSFRGKECNYILESDYIDEVNRYPVYLSAHHIERLIRDGVVKCQ